MSVFQSRTGAGLALVLAFAPAIAFAQASSVGPPRQLVPAPEAAVPQAQPPAPRPASEAGAIPSTEGVSGQPLAGGASAPAAGIEIQQLTAIDSSSVGVLDAEAGGFGFDMWAGTSRGLVEGLLLRLPAGVPSRAMNGLMRRVLLSTARVPTGDGRGVSLLGARVERLAAMGDMEGVQALLAVAPAQNDDRTTLKVDVSTRLLTGDHAGVCMRSRTRVREDDDPYWLKTLAFCQALEGDHAAALLGVNLLREEDAGDTVFADLVGVLAGEDRPITSLVDPSPLHLAMLRAARLQIPADAVDGSAPAVLAAIATAPNASLETRIVAAERAEAVGALDTGVLGRLYASVSFSPDDLGNALEIARTDTGPRGRALLYQSVRVESVARIRAVLLDRLWEISRATGRFEVAARVNAGPAIELEPSADLVAMAGNMGRALLAAGEVGSAMAWHELAQRYRGPDEDRARTAAAALAPLIAITDLQRVMPWSRELLAEWKARHGDLSPSERRTKLSTLVSIIDGLGFPIAKTDWDDLLVAAPIENFDVPYFPSPALWRGLEMAAKEGRVGETVLLAMTVLGHAGPAGAHPLTLRAVLSALRQVGLETEARAIGLEAALSQGL